MIQTQPAEFSSFHGGITDYNVNGPTAKFLTGDNLDIIPSGKFGRLKQRNGFELFESRINTTKEVHTMTKYVTYAGGISQLVTLAQNELYIFDGTTWDSYGAVGNVTGVSTHYGFFEEWNKKLYFRYSGNIAGDQAKGFKKLVETSSQLELVNFNIHEYFAEFPSFSTPGGSTYSFIYAVVPKETYTHRGVTYVKRGEPNYYTPVTTDDANGNSTFDYSPTAPLTPPSGVTMVYEIYRTTDGGTVFYNTNVTIPQQGGTGINVSISDTNLINNETLYTTGGVVPLSRNTNFSAYRAKYMHVVGDIGYFAGNSNRLFQSVPGNPEWVNNTLYADLDEDIQGLSSVKSTPIAITSKSAYRIDGVFDELGRGGMLPQRISERTDCVNFASVVQTENGVFWCGKDAFYYTDGYTVIRLNEDWDQTHATFTEYAKQREYIRGTYDKKNQRIYWTALSKEEYEKGAAYQDRPETIITLHLYFGIKQNAAFTIYRDNIRFNSTSPVIINDVPNFISYGVYADDGILYRGSLQGCVFQHTDSIINDQHIQDVGSTSTWVPTAVRWTYESCSFNYGTDFMRKFVPWMLVRCKKESDLAFQIQSNNDDGAIYKNLALINNTTAKNNSGYYEEMRRFPKGGLRCSTKSIRMFNPTIEQWVSGVNTLIFQFQSGTTTKTLSTWFGDTLPEQTSGLIGKYIAFTAFPGLEFLIVSQSTDTIQILDPNLALASMDGVTQYTCSISSVPYDQIFHLMGYTVHYAVFGKTHDKFQTSENPGGVAP